MKQCHWLKYLYLAYFAKPVADRLLFRKISQSKPTRVVHIGLGSAERSRLLLDVVGRFASGPIQYTGVDLFEATGRTSLKDFHRLLQREGVKVKLVPGEPYAALARFANVLSETNLLLIGKDVDEASIQHAWFYVPRMLAEGAVILREQVRGNETRWESISVQSVFQWADEQRTRRRAA